METQTVFHHGGTHVQQLLPTGKIDGQHLLIEFPRGEIIGVLVFEIHRIAKPADVNIRPFPLQKLRGRAREKDDLHPLLVREHQPQHFFPLLFRKIRLFSGVDHHRRRHFVEQFKAVLDERFMSQRGRIERARKYAFSHDTLFRPISNFSISSTKARARLSSLGGKGPPFFRPRDAGAAFLSAIPFVRPNQILRKKVRYVLPYRRSSYFSRPSILSSKGLSRSYTAMPFSFKSPLRAIFSSAGTPYSKR